MKITTPNETRQQKLEYLTNNGYLHNLRGEGYLSTKAAKPPHKTARGYVHHLHPR